MNRKLPSRRTLLQGAAAASLAVPFSGLYTRRAAALTRMEPIPSPYGPVAPVRDQITGLPLLQLPQGFTYQTFGWSGDLMDDGNPTPIDHDGMAVVRSRLVNGQPEFTLVRNHEDKVNPAIGTIQAAAIYDTAEVDDDGDIGGLSGGTTNLIFRGGRFVSAMPSLGGTYDNCAGGPTPWGTWLTCEEDLADFSDQGGRAHGYVFEVAADPGETSGNPIIGMGRMDHEAVAYDPVSGAIFLTEDNRNIAGLYKFEPADTSKRLGSLEQGGTLFMAKAVGEDRLDLLDPIMGDSYQIEWVEIEDPDMAPAEFEEYHAEGPGETASGPFLQGRERGALRFSRLEGCWYSASDGLIYLVDTSSGIGSDEEDGVLNEPGYGDGSVWTLDPLSNRLTCIYQSANASAGNNFDNVTVSPRGGVLLCEDGGGFEDAFGLGERLMGLTPAGETYLFAKNNIMLSETDIRTAGKSLDFIEAGDHRTNEWAGATFDPSGRVLFINIQDPGITFAITGPWERGLL
ncbi:MAG: alkaline phosphatase PhoX [Pseudomonadota bacterium]